ncbi:hypothetical protein PV326_005430 [Microctonus aethiopoides]|nr:hypothetical protein PV326_005430 [Microctonus aethiopoides]
MCERNQPDNVDETDRVDDAVDPRVQIELERLNTATDDINKLEVDLDATRATFRELLCESTMTIETLSKKLGACIDKSRPYYDARFKAKEALREAQKAAIRFERANGQHAAAKEMVYLAEEGLRMEGRCFDHAWQEMLNHATERVNESEHERALSEAEHRHMTAIYHNAEHNVQRLQSELKRAITKSRPYYEMKAQFNQALEKQKTRVGILEQSVGEAKMTYAEALRNLEKISDEIHRTRSYEHSSNRQNNSDSVKTDTNQTSNTSSESSITGSPDSTDYMSDEYLRLPDKMSPNAPCPIERDSSMEFMGLSNIKNLSSTEPRKYIKRERPRSIAALSINSPQASQACAPLSQLNFCKSFSTSSTPNFQDNQIASNDITMLKRDNCNNQNDDSDNNHEIIDDKTAQNNDEWTEISLNNSPDTIFYNNEMYSDDDDQIPYKPMSCELSPDTGHVGTFSTEQSVIGKKRLVNQQSLPAMLENNELTITTKRKLEMSRSPSNKSRGKLDSSLANWITRSSAGNSAESSSGVSGNSSRRQSLDMLWTTGTGERMKELLSHGMMMLNISSLTERRSSEPKVLETDNNREKEDANTQKSNDKVEMKGKKVPSPLEKTMTYLNPDDETSDSESLASVEMLTEDQISSLMMEPDMNQVCQDVLGTPLVEVCPLLQQLQEQQ